VPRETRRDRRSNKTAKARRRGSRARVVESPDGRFAPAALIGALVLAIVLLAPFFVWGNPYPDEVIRYWVWGSALVVIAVGAAALGPVDGALRRIGRLILAPPPALFALIVAVATAGLALYFSASLFHHAANTSDEIAQLWQAKILLHGRLSLPVDPNREFFSLDTVIDSGAWYSQFPIGGPFVLAFGALVGAPWAVDPVLAGLSAALIYDFARRTFGEATGRASALVFATAPMILIMSATWMNHVPVMLLALVALDCLARWDALPAGGSRTALAAAIGLAVGVMATIRPLDAVVAALAIGVFQLIAAWRDRSRWRDLVVVILCGVIGVLPLLVANTMTTGGAFTFGYDEAWGRGHDIGFHLDPYGVPHTVAKGLDYAVSYVGELNIFLTAWPIPVLLILILGLLALRRTTRWDALLLGLFGAQVAAYASYWFQGELLGPRFLFTALPAVVVLVVRAPFALGERFGERVRRGAMAATIACIAVAWCAVGADYGVWGLARQARGARLALKIDVGQAVRTANVHHALVVLHERFGSQLLRRLWGLGVTRASAVRLLESRDACSLLDAIRAAESDSGAQLVKRMTPIVKTATFTPSGPPVETIDPTVHISSAASITPECRAALEADARYSEVPFGPGLVLEPIDRAGRIDGDVVYVADLGERNERLRTRFGDRTWYRIATVPRPGAPPRAVVVPY
jgi:4-amino-4-deoxy-L-arabinose transferase-like glycosyltransferase